MAYLAVMSAFSFGHPHVGRNLAYRNGVSSTFDGPDEPLNEWELVVRGHGVWGSPTPVQKVQGHLAVCENHQRFRVDRIEDSLSERHDFSTA